MKQWMSIMAAIAVLAAVSARAEDKAPAPPPKDKAHTPMQRGEHLLGPKMLEQLALTADQKTKYDDLEKQYSQERDKWMEAHKAELDQARKDLEAAKASGDKEKMREAGKKLGETRQPMMQLHKQYLEKVRALLTPEQVKTLDTAPAPGRGRDRQGGGHKTE